MSKNLRSRTGRPNAADQLAYLNLLLGEDVDQNFFAGVLPKKLAEQYPNRLSYRVTTALGYLRQHDPASALAQFKGACFDRLENGLCRPGARFTPPRFSPAIAMTKHATLLHQFRCDRLNPQERELIDSPQGSN